MNETKCDYCQSVLLAGEGFRLDVWDRSRLASIKGHTKIARMEVCIDCLPERVKP